MVPLSTHLFSHWSIPLMPDVIENLCDFLWFTVLNFGYFFIFQTWAFWAPWFSQPFSSLPGGQSTRPAWGPCTVLHTRGTRSLTFSIVEFPAVRVHGQHVSPCTTYRGWNCEELLRNKLWFTCGWVLFKYWTGWPDLLSVPIMCMCMHRGARPKVSLR